MADVLFLCRQGCRHSDALEESLLDFGYNLTVHKSSNSRNQSLPEEILWWRGEYIFSFRSLYVLPQSLLDRASVAAINFHPGPPEYPGGGCTNFALLNDESMYGVTAHLMDQHIDNGKILMVQRFPISTQDNVVSLTRRTHQKLFSIASTFIESIALLGNEYIATLAAESEFNWREWKGSIKQIDKLSILAPELSRKEMLSIIRAAHTSSFPVKMVCNDLEFVFARDLLCQ
tara:strand:- start:1408 stop:2100 length:693 start_codon:yes stop_codon:yes gene_type:complete